MNHLRIQKDLLRSLSIWILMMPWCTHKPYRELLQAVFNSLVETPEMVLTDPRAGFFNCVDTGWHTDANTRGSHPNAVRLLDAGGFIRI